MASRKRVRTKIGSKREVVERQRQRIYKLQHEWKMADIFGNTLLRNKIATSLIAAERKLDRMLGLRARSYGSAVFIGERPQYDD